LEPIAYVGFPARYDFLFISPHAFATPHCRRIVTKVRLTLSPGIAGRLRDRDPAAFDELLRVAGPPIIAFLSSYLPSRDAAEDVLQDVVFRIFQQGDRFAPGKSVEAYLFSSARNAALNVLRNADTRDRYTQRYVDEVAHLPNSVADAHSVATPDVRDNQLSNLRRAIRALNEHQRATLQLRYAQGLTIPEIAHILGISAKGVERLLTRVKKLLRDQIIGNDAAQPE
jgi:RNA polymerase sigma-70 factor, ECF subfamily